MKLESLVRLPTPVPQDQMAQLGRQVKLESLVKLPTPVPQDQMAQLGRQVKLESLVRQLILVRLAAPELESQEHLVKQELLVSLVLPFDLIRYSIPAISCTPPLLRRLSLA
ncbi:MAG: hypothetical protein ACUZ8A_02660 [Candidatus Bathyanammoxibius sp.]